MKTYQVLVSINYEGYVDIEADSPEKAESMAYFKVSCEGEDFYDGWSPYVKCQAQDDLGGEI